jgi:hypothetical protein
MKKLPTPGEGLAPQPPVPTRLPAATSRWSPVSERITDTVYAEHPNWSLGEILAEARRRHQADERAGQDQVKERDPPSGSSGERSA